MKPVFARAVSAALSVIEPLFDGRVALARRRARALVEGGEPERAILYCHRQLARHPDDPWLHFQAGRAAQARELRRLARVRFAHAAALEPDEPTFRFALGYALRHDGHMGAAAREYRQALQRAPDEPRILFNLGVVERERDRLEVAQRCFEKVVGLWPKDARAHYTLGVCAFERRDFATARVALERALEIDRRHHKALYQRGLLALDDGRPAEGVVDLQKVLSLRGDYGPAHYALGRALLDRAPTRARHHFHEALVGRPPVLRAHLDLGRLFEKSGELERARAEFALYARHHPGKREAWIEQRLAEIDRKLAAAREAPRPAADQWPGALPPEEAP